MHSGWMYLVAVLNWYSRYVVSWALDQTLEIGFVLEAVEKALRLASPMIWNSDQGCHFTSPQYTALLLEAKVQISMDGWDEPSTTSLPSGCGAPLKYEEVYLRDDATPREAQTGQTRYFEFYNCQRLHRSLASRTPVEVYFQKGAASTLNSPDFLS